MTTFTWISHERTSLSLQGVTALSLFIICYLLIPPNIEVVKGAGRLNIFVDRFFSENTIDTLTPNRLFLQIEAAGHVKNSECYDAVHEVELGYSFAFEPVDWTSAIFMRIKENTTTYAATRALLVTTPSAVKLGSLQAYRLDDQNWVAAEINWQKIK